MTVCSLLGVASSLRIHCTFPEAIAKSLETLDQELLIRTRYICNWLVMSARKIGKEDLHIALCGAAHMKPGIRRLQMVVVLQ